MRGLPLAVGGAGLAVTLGSAAAALGERSFKVTSYSTASPGLALLSSLTGALLFASALMLATDPTRAKSALTVFGLGLAWSAEIWAGWTSAPTGVRNLGMLLAPMVAPALLLAAACWPDRASGASLAVGVAAATVAAGLVLWLVRDPFLDRYCWRDCAAHAFAPFPDVHLARTMTDVTFALGAACGVVCAALCARCLRRTLAFGAVAGCAMAVSDTVVLVEPAEDPGRPLFALLFAWRAVALAGFALAVAYVALRPHLVRRAIARLAAGGAVAAALADAIGDPNLRVGYPVPGGGVVDAGGVAVTFEQPPTRIVRGAELVAVVGSAGGAPQTAALDRALGPAARLALANERLRAEQLARLRELTDLRRRIVATGDSVRRRLERDLHDGAQQRLLALAVDLRVALNRAEAAGRREAAALLREAVDDVCEAIEELRSVAHGIFPSMLATSGLAAALETLADSRALVLSVDLPPGRRFPDEVEAATYALVAGGTDGALEPLRVRVAEREESLWVSVERPASNGAVRAAEDRVGAAGGTVTWTGRRLEALLPVPPPA
jgi:signal transduction histidine kinase